MIRNDSTLGRALAVLLCVSLLLGSVVSLAEEAVANVTDSEGPKLYDFRLVPNGKDVKIGKKVEVSLNARDRSGVNNVSVEFYNAETEDWKIIGLYYNALLDLYVGETTITNYWTVGTYVVSAINAYDQYGNRTYCYTYDDSSSLGKFTVKAAKSSKLDASVTIKEDGKTLKPKKKVTAEVEVKKPKETDQVAVILRNHYKEDYNVSIWIWCNYDKESGKFIGTSTFTENNYNGTYELEEVRAFKDDELIAKDTFSGQSVTLKGGKEPAKDTTPPKISSGKIKEKGQTLGAGATIHISAKIKGKAEITYATAYLYAMEGNWWANDKEMIARSSGPDYIGIDLQKKGKNKFEAEYTLPQELPNCMYCLEIDAGDANGNWNWVFFDQQYFTFEDKDFVTSGISNFVQQTVQAITGNAATDDQIKELGMLLAEGKANAVQIVKKIVAGAGLSQEDKVKKLAVFMKGEEPSAEELARLVKLGDEALIDELSDGEIFRALCNDSDILMGSFGRRKDGVEIGATPVKKIKLNTKKAELKVGKKLTLKATVTPDDATDPSVEWTSSDESVATVSSKGKVKAVGAGTCKITCKAKDGSGKKATCTITVKGDSANKNLKLSEEKLKLKVGETAKLKLADEDVEVKWRSSDKSVAKVNSKGKVTAIGKGKCTITCEAADGSAKIEIPVKVK